MVPLVVGERDKAMIASPGVIRRTHEAQHLPGSILRGHDDEPLPFGYLTRHLVIGLNNVIENRCPIGIGMRPCELHTPLGLPFGWKSPFPGPVFCHDVHIWAQRYKIIVNCEFFF